MSILGWLGKSGAPAPNVTSKMETSTDAESYDPDCSFKTIRVIDPRSLSPVHRPDLYRTAKRSKLTSSAGQTTPERTVLGVLGTRSSVRYADMEEQVLAPVLEAWGTPDELILPADGESSYVLQAWATRSGVPVRLVSADWTRNGRKAGALRDAVIQREATHFVLLQGPRSNTLMTLAGRLHRKKRPVVISERPGKMVKAPGQVEFVSPK